MYLDPRLPVLPNTFLELRTRQPPTHVVGQTTLKAMGMCQTPSPRRCSTRYLTQISKSLCDTDVLHHIGGSRQEVVAAVDSNSRSHLNKTCEHNDVFARDVDVLHWCDGAHRHVDSLSLACRRQSASVKVDCTDWLRPAIGLSSWQVTAKLLTSQVTWLVAKNREESLQMWCSHVVRASCAKPPLNFRCSRRTA